MYPPICGVTSQKFAVDIELFQLQKMGFYAPPDPNIAAHPTRKKSVVVYDFSAVIIDQVENGIISPALFQRKAHHANKCGVWVSFIPFYFSHLMPFRRHSFGG